MKLEDTCRQQVTGSAGEQRWIAKCLCHPPPAEWTYPLHKWMQVKKRPCSIALHSYLDLGAFISV
eukprot:1395599-Amphidinium_carterae.1